VLFDERYCYFYKDGKVYSWTKEPSLKLIKKAKKKVKKYRWGIYHYRTNSVGRLDEYYSGDGDLPEIDGCVLICIPGTEIEVEE
jgi:hypothetical protein